MTVLGILSSHHQMACIRNLFPHSQWNYQGISLDKTSQLQSNTVHLFQLPRS
uniref:Uncharacterized protein n=1 Tax=Rhizophora mucronata TaxID=61149 RepID=A0A2P2PG76_RHIMU